MPFAIGEVVRVQGDDTEGAYGRVCYNKGGGWYCVQWHGQVCTRSHEADLEASAGDAPDCSASCSGGQC